MENSLRPNVKKIQAEKYSFETADGIKYYVSLKKDEMEKPYKLGDGAFGIVYNIHRGSLEKVNNPEKEREVPGVKEYALKIFYEIDEKDGGLTKERLKNELTYAEDIHRETNEIIGVIEPIGKVEEFKNTTVYKQFLQPYFEKEGIIVSNYALVLPYYDCTLKELLEGRKWFPNNGAKSTDTKKVNGYEALKKVKHERRVIDMYPFLLDIVVGLKTLYSADYTHLDIKPANIFIKNKGEKFETVLADMGLINSKDSKYNNTEIAASFTNISMLGTRHYRSPEQKDFFDICDAEVKKEEEGGNIKLIIRDRKFKETIIEKGDYAIFDKAREKEYEIYKISKDDSKEDVVTIELGKISVEPDRITQVRFRKRQGIRTDLFGLGAIAFDILSCGESPEIFYDNIRGLDTAENHVDRIMEKYRQVAGFNTTEPDSLHIFKAFKHKSLSEYAPEEIVRFIIKCMMYRAKGSYYNLITNDGSSKDYKEENILQGVLNDLKGFQSVRKNNYHENCIAYKVETFNDQSNSSSFDSKLEDLKEISSENLHERIFKGLKYYRLLIESIIELIGQQQQDKNFLVELRPENIEVSFNRPVRPELKYNYITYETRDSYIEDLLYDNVYTKIRQDKTHYYVPPEIAYIRRKIDLWIEKEKSKEANGPESLYFNFELKSASFPGDEIKAGDWIAVSKGNEFLLLKINLIENQILHCIVEKSKPEDIVPKEYLSQFKEPINAIYYREIDMLGYYLYILGVYLQQIFFVGIEGKSADKPSYLVFIQYFLNEQEKGKVVFRDISNPKHLMEKLLHRGEKSSAIKLNENHWEKSTSLSKDGEILTQYFSYIEFMVKLARQYLFLTMPDLDDSYYKRFKNNHDIKACLSKINEVMRIKGNKKADIVGANLSLGLCNNSNSSLYTTTSAKSMIENFGGIAKDSAQILLNLLLVMPNFLPAIYFL